MAAGYASAAGSTAGIATGPVTRRLNAIELRTVARRIASALRSPSPTARPEEMPC